MEFALLVFIGCVLFVVFYAIFTQRAIRKEEEQLYKQDPDANLARLKAQMSAQLANARQINIDTVIQALSLERARGAGWDVAIKAALPNVANVQALQVRNSIIALVQAGKSEQAAVETVIRNFAQPPGTSQ